MIGLVGSHAIVVNHISLTLNPEKEDVNEYKSYGKTVYDSIVVLRRVTC